MGSSEESTVALVKKKGHEECPYDPIAIKYWHEKRMDEREAKIKAEWEAKEAKKSRVIMFLLTLIYPTVISLAGWMYWLSVSHYVLKERVVTIDEIREVIKEGNQIIIEKIDDHEMRLREIEKGMNHE